MHNVGYRTLAEDSPPQSNAVCVPPNRERGSRLRESALRIPRSRTYRRSLPENCEKALTLDKNRPATRSPSTSPSLVPKRPSARQEPSSDLDPSPLCTPKGYLAFVDSSPEREERKEKTIIPPADVLLSCPLGPDVTSVLEMDARFPSSPPSTPPGCLNVTASSGPKCRICHEGDQEESLTSLCKCSGTMGLLHVSCLERWLNARNIDSCELCYQCFPTAPQPSGMRGFVHWALHGDSHRAVLGDLFCFAVLTPVALLSCFLCTHKASKQALEGHVNEAASLVALAGILAAAYLAWAFVTMRFHYRAFTVWQARNPIRRIVAPSFAGRARGSDRATAEQPAGPLEMVGVVSESVNDTARTTQRQGVGALRLSLERSPNALSATWPSALQQSIYTLGPFAGFEYW
ncbi:hypothetical protein HPB50_005283 [Hyalomma asiaticum]|uniref:Uncharacterized protein n=1 Tax=Hyalomma asiaticum TaxID=266040 RepID=A0ACB7TFH1_HYAAI|nr:hypothetical protein HPB50_005283 [Hyalomma asiaticum]